MGGSHELEFMMRYAETHSRDGSLSRSPGASASKTDAGQLPKGRNGSITQSPGPAGRKEGNHVC